MKNKVGTILQKGKHGFVVRLSMGSEISGEGPGGQ